jgi:hypothetical protein
MGPELLGMVHRERYDVYEREVHAALAGLMHVGAAGKCYMTALYDAAVAAIGLPLKLKATLVAWKRRELAAGKATTAKQQRVSTDGGTRGNRLGRGAPLRTAAAAPRDNPSAAADSVAAADPAVFDSSRAETAAASDSSRATCDGRAGVAPTLANKRELKGKAGGARGAALYKRCVEHEIATMQQMDPGTVVSDVNPFCCLAKEILLLIARDAGVDVACIEEDAHMALQVATEAVLLEAF